MRQKATSGLYHVHLDRDVFDEQERSLFLSDLGDRFGAYVARFLDEMYPPVSGRLIHEQELKRRMGSKSKRADAVILAPDAAVVIEAKATLFPLAVRAGWDFTSLEAKTDDIFVVGAAQINATIEWLRSTGLSMFGVPVPRTRFYPLIVVLDQMPMSPWLHRVVEARLSMLGRRSSADVAPLQVIGIDELEMLPSLLAVSRLSMVDLLSLKTREGAADISLRNFLHNHRPDWLASAEPPDWMKHRFQALTNHVIRMIGPKIEAQRDKSS